jgi:hypothetical protein
MHMSTDNTPSPLLEASPDSLDELMSRNPEAWSDADLDRLVNALRAQRAKFDLSESEGKRPAVTRKAKPKAVSIEDLGF